MSDFDSQKFETDSNVGTLAKGTDGYANHRGAYISFQHVPSKRSVKFKAFITAFNESYNSDWATETVFGRVDPIYLFKSTTRKITLGFKLPAESASEAFENLGRIQKLLQFLYPNYTVLDDPLGEQSGVFAQTISQSPMIRLKVMNLLADATTAMDVPTDPVRGKGLGDFDYYTGGGPGLGIVGGGLLGVIDNVTVNHNLEGNDGVLHASDGVILPKLIDVNLNFSPIHEHPIGWSDRKELYKDKNVSITQVSQPLNALFPYAINLLDGHPTNGIEVNITPEGIAASQAISGDGTDSLSTGGDSAASAEGDTLTKRQQNQAQKAEEKAEVERISQELGWTKWKTRRSLKKLE
tara:strand:- start:813 stop:1868 length:1056 start_codon:yes stop_codon:yes gene_type:complete